MGKDNQSCLALVYNLEATGRTKHVDVAYHMVRDYETCEDVAFYFLPSADMQADGLTKPLLSPALTAFRAAVGVGEDARLSGATVLATPCCGSAEAPWRHWSRPVARARTRGSDLRRPCRGPLPVVDCCATIHLPWASNGTLLPCGDGRLGQSWGAVAPLGATSGAAAGSRRSPDLILPKSILGDFGRELLAYSSGRSSRVWRSRLFLWSWPRCWKTPASGQVGRSGPNRFGASRYLVECGIEH